MKTPEEIKKGLECCNADACYHTTGECPYDGVGACVRNMCADALAYIQQLERERDAAVEDINEAAKTGCLCYVCKFDNKGYCSAFDRGIFEAAVMCGQYKWRGVQEVE